MYHIMYHLPIYHLLSIIYYLSIYRDLFVDIDTDINSAHPSPHKLDWLLFTFTCHCHHFKIAVPSGVWCDKPATAVLPVESGEIKDSQRAPQHRPGDMEQSRSQSAAAY